MSSPDHHFVVRSEANSAAAGSVTEAEISGERNGIFPLGLIMWLCPIVTTSSCKCCFRPRKQRMIACSHWSAWITYDKQLHSSAQTNLAQMPSIARRPLRFGELAAWHGNAVRYLTAPLQRANVSSENAWRRHPREPSTTLALANYCSPRSHVKICSNSPHRYPTPYHHRPS